MTIQEAGSQLLFQLYHLYDNSEAANIADLVMENVTGWKRIDRIVHKQVRLSHDSEMLLMNYMQELSAGKPVQYVLGEAWFGGMKFFVNDKVLIPRPETEELVEWAAASINAPSMDVLDIGTGSGCIAISIKNKSPESIVYATDISGEALAVAEKNAASLHAGINFIQADILQPEQWNKFPPVDIIISNPPYIPAAERSTMHKNVTDYEPPVSLFVNDDDPLIFYKAIAAFSKIKLRPAGNIFLEVHELHAAAVAALFQDAMIRKDLQGKERMVKV